MAVLVKSVRIDGSGDYTDLSTGVTDILSSGVAASGTYDTYILNVDDSNYSGNFNALVPYSGKLYIKGSGTWFYTDDTNFISGEFPVDMVNVYISDMYIVASGLDKNVFSVASGGGFELDNVTLMDAASGILNSGYVSIKDSSLHGRNTGYGVNDLGSSLIDNSKIAYFYKGLITKDSTLNAAEIFLNSINVQSSGSLFLNSTLIHGPGSGIVAYNPTTTGFLSITNSTIDCPTSVWSNGSELNLSRSIIYGSGTALNGTYAPGSYADYNCLYPSGTISGTGNIYTDPLFKDRDNNDYRLKFRQTVGSPAIDLVDKGEVASGVNLVIDNGQIVIRDHRGFPRQQVFNGYIYRQGSTLLFSDYGRETQLADAKSQYKNLTYEVYTRAEFTASGVPLVESFSTDPEVINNHPWDWDYKEFETTEITDEHRYIIPRTVLDVLSVLNEYIYGLVDSTVFGMMTKDSIIPYMNYDYRGVAFDYDLSIPGEAIVWMIEGNNQLLTKLNAFSAERLEEFPISVPAITGKMMIRPSGLIPGGVYKDGYRFYLESNPQEDFIAETEDGLFKWIATNIDLQKDIRGILAYKDKIYITSTEYSIPVYNRSIVTTNSGVGKLYMYDNNSSFEHYITNYTTRNSGIGPTVFPLSSRNNYPTDITVYEDGKIYIADYTNNDILYIYKFAYDYALIRGSYDQETSVLLRENYSDVQI